MKDTLKKLLATYGPTGREAGIAKLIEGLVKPYVDEIRTDALGNLIAIKKGAGKRVMVAAHMDQIGFIVTDIDDKGFLRVHNVGGIRRAFSINRRVVFENGMSGILSCEEKDNDPADKTMLKLFIDIGCRDKKEAEKLIRRGDVCVYSPDVFEMNELVCGPALDDRAGCALLIETLKALKNCPNEVIAVFTAQEEVGLRGARTAAFDVSPDVGIALDVTLAGDVPKGPDIAVEVGAGVAVKVMDSSLICTPWVVDKLEALAAKGKISNQREVLTGGGTDAGAIQLTRGGIPSGVLSVPCRYVHSATEAVSMEDMAAGVKLLTAFLMDESL